MRYFIIKKDNKIDSYCDMKGYELSAPITRYIMKKHLKNNETFEETDVCPKRQNNAIEPEQNIVANAMNFNVDTTLKQNRIGFHN